MYLLILQEQMNERRLLQKVAPSIYPTYMNMYFYLFINWICNIVVITHIAPVLSPFNENWNEYAVVGDVDILITANPYTTSYCECCYYNHKEPPIIHIDLI
jgi:hypothetical protein